MSSTVIPTLRYRDAPGAIEFLTTAFGFEARMVIEGEAGTVDHAQLVLGTGMIMLGSQRDDEYGRLLDDTAVSSVYVVVTDVSAHAEQARQAGATILMDPEEQDYGGSNYIARDLEGNIWSFGSYDPWAEA